MNDSLITISQNLSENINLINQVNDFYDQAWGKLVLTGTIALGIIGIIVPSLVQWYQNKKMIIRESELENKFKKYAEQINTENEVKFNTILNSSIDALRVENDFNLKQIENLADGYAFFVQAAKLLSEKNYELALLYYIRACNHLIKAKRFRDAHSASKNILMVFDKLIEQKTPMNKHTIKHFDDLLSTIINHNDKEHFANFISNCIKKRNALNSSTSNPESH